MIIKKIEDFTRGWIIGDFEPSILRTKDFEVGINTYRKGEKSASHIHKECDEYNIVINGKMIIQETELNTGDVYIISKNEIADPVFLEDCTLLAIKVPSVIGDKYEVF